jgi:eukaryotic-like serine/threonine-protein kinase
VLDVAGASAGHGEAGSAFSLTTRARLTATLTLVAALVVAGVGLGWPGIEVWRAGASDARGSGLVGTLLTAVRNGSLRRASSNDTVPAEASEQTFRSLAVLPFDRADGEDSDVDYLSEGLSEGLIDRLSQLPDLKVIARSSSFRYRAGEIDPRAVGRALGVEALVVGRVSRRRDELLVRAELVDARLGTQVWSEQYRRPPTDLQDVQEEIVHTIVERLHVRLTAGHQERLARSATVSHQAYLLYLTGLYHLRRGTTDELQKAIDHGQEAVAIDSTFARAWLLIAQAHWALSGNSVADPRVALPRARAAVLRALAIDETLAEAHLSLALLEQDDWNWAEAERQFTRAIELNPSLAGAHGQYGRFLSVLGRFDEALAAVRRAQALDPLQSSWRAREGVILYFARRYSEAIGQLQYAVSSEPGRAMPLYFLGMMHESAGEHERAIEVLQQVVATEPTLTSARVALGCALASSGRKARARAELEILRRGPDYVSPTELAALHVALDEKEHALALLEQAYAARDLQLQYLNVVPHFDALRSEQRFRQIVRSVGLPQ